MIVVEWRDGKAVILDGGELSTMPESTRDRVARVLKLPASVQRSFEIPDGGIEERLVKIAPGEPGHARAALLSLPDAALVVDTGPA
jgi:hypothetical protein